MARSTDDPDDVNELAQLMMKWIGLSMKTQRGTGGMDALNDAGLTIAQVAAIHVLMFEGKCSVSALTERLGLSVSATSHLVQRLVEQGFATREEDETDRRQKVVTLAAAGRKLVEKLMKSRLEEMRGSVRHLSTDVRAELLHVIPRVIEDLAWKLGGPMPEVRGIDADQCGADLDGRKLDGVNLEGGRFEGATLEGASLRDAKLRNARFDGASLDGACLASAVLTHARFDGASCEGADFRNCDLAGARFDGSSVAGARFDGAKMRGARFDGADVSGASFINADVAEISFDGAELEGAVFRGARNLTRRLAKELAADHDIKVDADEEEE